MKGSFVACCLCQYLPLLSMHTRRFNYLHLILFIEVFFTTWWQPCNWTFNQKQPPSKTRSKTKQLQYHFRLISTTLTQHWNKSVFDATSTSFYEILFYLFSLLKHITKNHSQTNFTPFFDQSKYLDPENLGIRYNKYVLIMFLKVEREFFFVVRLIIIGSSIIDVTQI